MIETYATGLLAIALVTAGWFAVQVAWRKSFGTRCGDPDVLAGRTSCHGCEGGSDCPSRRDSDD